MKLKSVFSIVGYIVNFWSDQINLYLLLIRLFLCNNIKIQSFFRPIKIKNLIPFMWILFPYFNLFYKMLQIKKYHYK